MGHFLLEIFSINYQIPISDSLQIQCFMHSLLHIETNSQAYYKPFSHTSLFGLVAWTHADGPHTHTCICKHTNNIDTHNTPRNPKHHLGVRHLLSVEGLLQWWEGCLHRWNTLPVHLQCRWLKAADQKYALLILELLQEILAGLGVPLM